LTDDSIMMSAPEIADEDIRAVADVVASGRLALGDRAEELERLIADHAGTRFGVAVSSGTAALHLIVRALGIGPGDEVLVPSFTFAASVNAFLFEGATPVFVDIEPETMTLDPSELEAQVTERTKAVMAVDVFGHPVEWDEVTLFAERHALHIVDDSCEALGARYKGRALGAFGDAAAFAFYPNKQITTGEGGMIVTENEEIARLCRSMRNQGRPEMGQWLEHVRLGFNYRMDELSAGLGVSQFRRLEAFLEKRENVAATYTQLLSARDWVATPLVKPYVRMSWFVYVVTLAEGIDRDRAMQLMAADGIPTRAYFSPLHLQPYIRERPDIRKGPLPVTENVARRTVALPFHNNVTLEQAERVVASLTSAVEHAG
jgi:perosamine synthetase